jgi:hypothetical protein
MMIFAIAHNKLHLALNTEDELRGQLLMKVPHVEAVQRHAIMILTVAFALTFARKDMPVVPSC